MNPQLKIQQGLAAIELARRERAARRPAQAADAYNRALALMPDHPVALLEFAQLADEVEDWAAAARLYRRLAVVRPQSGYEPFLGRALFHGGHYAEAIPLLETHLARKPQDGEVAHALANALCSTGRWEEGLARAEQAWQLVPDAKRLDAVLNALGHLARDAELDVRLGEALARFPDSREIRSLYSLHKLKAGDFGEGFRFYADFRWRNNLKTPADAGTPGDWWDGKPFDGTLLVTAEQGLGDEIMVSSMFPDLVAMGQRALIECDQRLLPVYQRSFPALGFVPRNRRKLAEAYAAGGEFRKVNALDMGMFLRQDRAAFPERRAWLQPDAARREALRASLRERWPGKRLVGISWKSARLLEGGADKSARLPDFAPLFSNADHVFINLQYGDVAADLAALRESGRGEVQVEPSVDPTNDIDGLFALVAALDLVVSTSNTTVHVAGAQGVPCFVMLPRTQPVLWYWGYRGTSTPWYPSLQLRRSDVEGEWSGLMEAVAAEVAALPVPGGD